MAKRYQHLSPNDRDRLAVLRSRGWAIRAIARALHRPPSTISRELRRNAAPIYRGAYLAHRAQRRAEERARHAVCHGRLRDPWARAYAARQLARGWSPELIAGRLRRIAPAHAVSHETIYNWVYHDARHLIRHLVRRHRRRRSRGYSRKHKTPHIPGRQPIGRPWPTPARESAIGKPTR